MPNVKIMLLGKLFEFRCKEDEVLALQEAAAYLETQMQRISQETKLSFEKLSISTALNIVHQLLALRHEKEHRLNKIQNKLNALNNQIELALIDQ